MKKYCFKLLALGVASGCLLTACGANNATAVKEQTPHVVAIETEVTNIVNVQGSSESDEPTLLPLFVGEAPISTLRSERYPDAIRASVVLQDLTDEVDYDLEDSATDGFTIYSGHDYRLVLSMRSDGGDIEDIELDINVPQIALDGSTLMIQYYAKSRTTSQGLMIARIFLRADDCNPTLRLSEESTEFCDSDAYLGTIGNTPTEIVLDFSIL